MTSAGVPLRRIAHGTPPQAGEYSFADGVLTVHDDTPIELATRLYAIKALVSNVKIAGLDIENYATCAVSWMKTIGGHSYWKAAVLFGSTAASGMVLENYTVANNAASAVAGSRRSRGSCAARPTAIRSSCASCCSRGPP